MTLIFKALNKNVTDDGCFPITPHFDAKQLLSQNPFTTLFGLFLWLIHKKCIILHSLNDNANVAECQYTV